MRQRVRTLEQRDFTGGLNVADDAFQLAQNQTPDCLNVQIMPKGGFQARRPLALFGDDTFSSGSLRNIWPFYGPVPQLVVQTANGVSYSTGAGVFEQATGTSWSITGRARGATMSRVTAANSTRLYLQRNIENVAVKFDGTAMVALTDSHGAYNENIAAPAGGKMPKAKFIAAHNNYLFHAFTLEGSTQYPFRVRWSHPAEPEDYRANDYVDIGLDDGDPITGIASFGSSLYVFKNRSVWILSGYDPDTFQLTKVTGDVGCVSQEAICVSQFGLFFFDVARGVFAFRDTSRSPQWLWPQLHTMLETGDINRTAADKVTMGCLDNRIFVAVPWEDANVNTRTFVFDPQCGRAGAWYPYEFGSADDPIDFGPMCDWREGTDSPPLYFAIGRNGTRVYRLSSETNVVDPLGQSTFTIADSYVGDEDVLGGEALVSLPFRSYLKTAWVTAGMPAVRKRWRRPSFVVDADTTGDIAVECFHDFAANLAKGVQTLPVSATSAGSPLWGEGIYWDDFTWSASSVGDQAIVRGTSLGSSYAVQLKFTGPAQARWGVNAIAFRYLPRKVR